MSIEKTDNTSLQMSQTLDITMPSLGADMVEGQLTEWLVKVGDKVKNGDIIAVLETQKGAIDMEVYHDGTIIELLLEPVVTVPVGTVMAKMTGHEEEVQAPIIVEKPIHQTKIEEETSPSTTGQTAAIEVISIKPEPSLGAKSDDEERLLMSPIVRQQMMKRRAELSSINGSGPGGAIILRDILPKQGQVRSTLVNQDSQKLNMRQAIAAAMEKSKQSIPHFYASLEINVSPAQQWLTQYNHDKTPEQQMLLLALILKSLARALLKTPDLNGFYQANGFVAAEGIHIGNIINLRGGGLMVAAIHDVDKLSVIDVMSAVRDITTRSRNGHLRSSELTDATITVTNTGERGVDSLFGVIYPPQVCIIALGKTRKIAQVIDVEGKDDLVFNEVVTVSLSADHRVVDGMMAAKFLNLLAKYLQEPEEL